MKLDELLSDRRVPFQRLHHRTAYGASRVAQLLHMPGKEMAKPVLLRTENGYVMAVVPANRHVDLDRVRQCLEEDWIEMADESEMRRVFPDCEVGAMPPFGSLYHVQTLVDDELAMDESIVFEGHNHEEAIRMAYKDFEAIEHPIKGHFASPR
jgi:Ala-tRNA(Pro) deacylase